MDVKPLANRRPLPAALLRLLPAQASATPVRNGDRLQSIRCAGLVLLSQGRLELARDAGEFGC